LDSNFPKIFLIYVNAAFQYKSLIKFTQVILEISNIIILREFRNLGEILIFFRFIDNIYYLKISVSTNLLFHFFQMTNRWNWISNWISHFHKSLWFVSNRFQTFNLIMFLVVIQTFLKLPLVFTSINRLKIMNVSKASSFSYRKLSFSLTEFIILWIFSISF
jgi:hypothetical protein